VLDWHLIAVRVSGDKADKSGDVSRVIDARLNALVNSDSVRRLELAQTLVHLPRTPPPPYAITIVVKFHEINLKFRKSSENVQDAIKFEKFKKFKIHIQSQLL